MFKAMSIKINYPKKYNDLEKPLLVNDVYVDNVVDVDKVSLLVDDDHQRKTYKLQKSLPTKKREWISEWKKYPYINPKDKDKRILPSLDPKSDYVRLYKDALKSLIKEKNPFYTRYLLPIVNLLEKAYLIYMYINIKRMVKSILMIISLQNIF
jgi:hypothetical protein